MLLVFQSLILLGLWAYASQKVLTFMMILIYSMMYRDPVPLSRKKKMETDVFLYTRIPKQITSLRRTGEAGKRRKRLCPEAKMWSWAFI